MELMVNGFAIDGYCGHEMSIFNKPPAHFNLFCSKQPQDIRVMRPLLLIDRNLWAVYVLRDPRDVAVSIHPSKPEIYWANLRLWKEYQQYARKAMDHPRFLTAKYEDLVRKGDRVQEQLEAKMPFLVKRSNFSEFHKTARPSQRSQVALGGIRALDAKSIGAWRRHKPRLVAQMQLHGSVAEDLIQLGYEPDDLWLKELEGVQPDNHLSQWPEFLPWLKLKTRRLEEYKNTLRYAIRTILS
jgi:hypothetical protein